MFHTLPSSICMLIQLLFPCCKIVLPTHTTLSDIFTFTKCSMPCRRRTSYSCRSKRDTAIVWLRVPFLRPSLTTKIRS
ncbi:hypothetical protein F5882DRAFT_418400 [Hyaloscypha sp. PMI_1271]|nr:hypothetical protein F5882DRAFT_418400 [Hyaloscypha sp. PMI_1271]